MDISLLIVLFSALITPLLMARFKISFIPTAVAEIIVGIILGKSLFNWVTMSSGLTQLSTLGVTILMFLSGMEVDFSLFKLDKKQSKKTQPLILAITAMITIIVIAAMFSLVMDSLGIFHEDILGTILFSTIALGVVIATLKEKEILSKPIGQTILLIAALGEIIPLVALTIYSILSGSQAQNVWLLSLILVVALFLLRFKRVYRFFARIDKSTTQLDIRLAFFLIFTLVSVAVQVGAENILGAFIAGLVMKALKPKQETEDKLTSIGYGFFIPIFFITTGVKLNLRELLADPSALVLIPFFLVGFYLAKVVVYPILTRRFKKTNALAGAFLTSTTITLVVPVLAVGQNLKLITSQQAGAFTLAAIVTTIISPMMFNKFFRPAPEDENRTAVNIIGVNMMTVPVAQQLTKGLYDIKMFSDNQKNYRTYNSEVDITLVPEMTEEILNGVGAFEADIVVLAYSNHDLDFLLAQWAIKRKPKRIISRFELKNVQDHQYDVLEKQGVEVFNTFEANTSLLRSLIESPATYDILTDTNASLFEVKLNNRKFAGQEIKDLPFVNDITISRIYRDGRSIQPHGDTQLFFGDHLLFLGGKDVIPRIREQLEKQN